MAPGIIVLDPNRRAESIGPAIGKAPATRTGVSVSTALIEPTPATALTPTSPPASFSRLRGVAMFHEQSEIGLKR